MAKRTTKRKNQEPAPEVEAAQPDPRTIAGRKAQVARQKAAQKPQGRKPLTVNEEWLNEPGESPIVEHLRILDDPHPMPNCYIVHSAQGWFLVAMMRAQDCTHFYHERITNCPWCQDPAQSRLEGISTEVIKFRTRRYIIGSNGLLDDAMRNLGLLPRR